VVVDYAEHREAELEALLLEHIILRFVMDRPLVMLAALF
jgi:hypothetical protein